MSSHDNFLFWIWATHFVPKLGFIFTTLFGSTLLLLNFLGAQKSFGTYKYLISMFTILGMTFSAIEILVYPNVHNFNAGFLFFSFEKTLGMVDSWNRNIPITAYTFFHSTTMALLSVQFIYRYWAIFDIHKLRYFKGANTLIWVAYCSFFGFQYSLGSSYFFKRDDVSDEYFRKEMLTRYNANIAELPAMAIVAYDPSDGSARWRNIMGIGNMCMVVNFLYGVMVFCGWSMHTKMEEKIQNFSDILRKHHKQFFKTLVLQITMPTIILFIPICIIMILPLLNLNISIPSGVMLCCFTLYPATDSLIVMYVVSEYSITARRLQKVICGRCCPTRHKTVLDTNLTSLA
ncbi:unnamed protein product [Caenorhabditis nigoni]